MGMKRTAVGAEPCQIRSLADPCVSFRRTVDAERPSASAEDALLADVPAGFRSARGQEAHDVGHVAPLTSKPPQSAG